MERSVPLLYHLAKVLGPHRCGHFAEKLAMVSYAIRGFAPLKVPQNLAQTDLIVRRGSLIVLVEVKFRGSRQRGQFAVTPNQKQRLQRQMHAVSGRFSNCTVRLEVFLVFLQFPFCKRIRNPYL
ncbi:MAG: hypothetical protein DI585_03260 [Pseudomonas fluorescens]|nr:MAG: hypothetical protein DI585_03260 [Pseudomonas fluorescens]